MNKTALITICLIAAIIVGCSEQPENKPKETAPENKNETVSTSAAQQMDKIVEKPKVVNTKCPIMGSTIDPEKVPDSLYRQFKGQGVGFCCGGCPEAWDKLTDTEKAKKLAAAIGK